VKSRLTEVSGGVVSAALLAAHRALIAAASCSRRSGERLSFLFTFMGALDLFAAAGFPCDFAGVLRFFLPAAAARAVDFFFAFAALAVTKAASFPFSLASFFGPSSSRVSRRRIFFLRVLNFITRSGWLVYIDKCRVDSELNDETSQMSRHCFAATSIRPTSSPFTSYLPPPLPSWKSQAYIKCVAILWQFYCLAFLRDTPR
jgi:hypothetical protein